jgi:hypothetical protein
MNVNKKKLSTKVFMKENGMHTLFFDVFHNFTQSTTSTLKEVK